MASPQIVRQRLSRRDGGEGGRPCPQRTRFARWGARYI